MFLEMGFTFTYCSLYTCTSICILCGRGNNKFDDGYNTHVLKASRSRVPMTEKHAVKQRSYIQLNQDSKQIKVHLTYTATKYVYPNTRSRIRHKLHGTKENQSHSQANVHSQNP